MPIIVYPVLMTSNINPNIIPGVCKTLEKYIIINKTDELLTAVKKKDGIQNWVKGDITESMSHIEIVTPIAYLTEADGPDGQQGSSEKQKELDALRVAEKDAQARIAAAEEKERRADAAWQRHADDYNELNRQTQEIDQKQQEARAREQETKNKQDALKDRARAAVKRHDAVERRRRELEKKNADIIARERRMSAEEKRLGIDKVNDAKAELEQLMRANEQESQRLDDEDRSIQKASNQLQQSAIKNAEDQTELKREKYRTERDRDKVQKDKDEVEITRQGFKDEEKELRSKMDDLKRREDQLRNQRATISIGMVDNKSLTMEPTTVTLDTGTHGTVYIGVKVMPYLVKSDAALTELLLNDRNLTKMRKTATILARKSVTRFYNTWYKAWSKIPIAKAFFKRSGTVAGSAKKDIIFKRTKISDRGGASYAMVNVADLRDDFFESAGGINKLFKLGWNTIIVVDDTNKRVAFCPPEYKGMCSFIPYQMLFAAAGREALGAFQDIEDAKSSSGPLFSRKGRITKMIGESVVSDKRDQYSTRITEAAGIPNNAMLSIQKMNKLGVVKSLKKIVVLLKAGNIKMAENELKRSGIKPADFKVSNLLLSFKKQFGKDYDKAFKLSKQIIKNSIPKMEGELLNLMSGFVSVTSFAKGSYDEKLLKKNLKFSVNFVRSSIEDAENEEYPEKLDFETKAMFSVFFLIAASLASGLGISFLGLVWYGGFFLGTFIFTAIVACAFAAVGLIAISFFGKT